MIVYTPDERFRACRRDDNILRATLGRTLEKATAHLVLGLLVICAIVAAAIS